MKGGTIRMRLLGTLRDFWRDDSGLDEHVARVVYLITGIVVASLAMTTAGLFLRNKYIGIGGDLGSLKVNVNTNNAAQTSNKVGFGSGTATVTTINVQ